MQGLPNKEIMCHHTGFAKSCFSCVVDHGCQKWVHILGNDPQTDKPLDIFMCSDALIPKLMIENSKLTLEVGAAIESFRNESVTRADELNENLKQTLNAQSLLVSHQNNVRALTYK